MVNLKQLNKLVAKVERLGTLYGRWLVRSRTELPAFIDIKGERKTVSYGDTWGEPFTCADFFVTLPALPEGRVYLECDNGGVESLVEIDGIPYGMTDWVRNAFDPEYRVHRYLPLEGVRTGARVRIEAYASHRIAGRHPYEQPSTFALRSLEEGARVFRGIYLVQFREEIALFQRNLRMLGNLYRAAPQDDWIRHDAYGAYEELFRVCSALPEQEPSAQSVAQANEVFARFFSALPEGREKPYLGLIGHSHLDTAWLWTVEEARRKAVRTAANAVTLLKRYPDYRFFMSSVLYLDWFKKDQPALFEEIGKLVREGRFEPNGATWVECDCNLTGAEAMVRQFVRGKLFLREQFGYEADTFWLPDTFGYSAALPQIMLKSGVKYFLTTKLSWNDTNAFPYESFEWQGIDGSRVLVHFNTIQSEADPEFLARRMKDCKNKHLDEEMLVAYGYGDGGGGPSDEMVSVALETQRTFPWAKAEHTSVSAFMKRLEKRELPRYCGELYLELHRGTLTMHHALKQNNRMLETALHNAEYFSVAAGKREWKERTDACYDTLMLNQFHDILPGTCIGEVNALARKENEEAIAELNALYRGDSEKGSYYNTLSFAREETLEGDGEQQYADFGGKIHSLARFSFAPYGKGKKIARAGKIEYRDGVVTTPFLRAVLKEGTIVSLIYARREFAAQPLNRLKAFECVPYLWDNWDIDADYDKKEEPVRFLSSEVISHGALQLRIRNAYAVCGRSTLVSDMIFDAFSPEIRFENKLDFQEDHSLLRVYFPTNLLAPSVKSQIQFGFIERSVYRNTSETQAQFEVCNHKWSDLSETNYGFSLFNDCKYGFSCEEGTLSLTLAKGGKHPDPDGDKGVRYFTYAIRPHRGGFCAKEVVYPAEQLNVAPVRTSLIPKSPLLSVSAEGVLCETVKYAERENAIVLRLYECERSFASARLQFRKTYRVKECNLLEDAERDLGAGDGVTLEFKPFEIKTLMLYEE